MTKLDMIDARSLRDLLVKANQNGIQKEDVVQIVRADTFFYMVYQTHRDDRED